MAPYLPLIWKMNHRCSHPMRLCRLRSSCQKFRSKTLVFTRRKAGQVILLERSRRWPLTTLNHPNHSNNSYHPNQVYIHQVYIHQVYPPSLPNMFTHQVFTSGWSLLNVVLLVLGNFLHLDKTPSLGYFSLPQLRLHVLFEGWKKESGWGQPDLEGSGRGERAWGQMEQLPGQVQVRGLGYQGQKALRIR